MTAKRLLGYCDPFSVQQGGRISFMVTCPEPEYRLDLVRLIHGDEKGPGFKEVEVGSAIDGNHPGRVQLIRAGSCVRVPHAPALDGHAALTVAAWVHPWLPGEGEQAIVAKGRAGEGGWALVLGASGAPELRVAPRGGEEASVALPHRLTSRAWSFVAASFDLAEGRVTVSRWSARDGWERVEGTIAGEAVRSGEGDLLIAAREGADGHATLHFNGKLDRPTLIGRALDPDELEALRASGSLDELPAIACWDFSREISSVKVRDVAGAHDGETVNMPTRAVTGHDWAGEEWDWTRAPEQYGAIHFHDDDLDDAGWEADVTFAVPDDLPSGVYSARLRAGEEEDHIPFVVRPARGRANAPIALLLPTFTYQAYGDELIGHPFKAATRSPEDDYITENRLLSQYNWHRDGSGVAFASRLRPMLTWRPTYRYWLTDFPHGLAADLYIVDWLDHHGIACDVLTDEDLDTEGDELLARYRVVLSGEHPEYTSAAINGGIAAYVEHGGRFMYLGGNGLCTVTARHPDRPHVTEIRRWSFTPASWFCEPGEGYLASSGEQGHFWSFRALRAREIIGVDCVFVTFDPAKPYVRLPPSREPRFAFVFEGVAEDGPIGDYGLLFGGAAGMEIDAVDYVAGTPEDCVVLAHAVGFSEESQPGYSDIARADMAFRSTPSGGAVFSVSSMTWVGSLSHDGYENDVSRITLNVLRAFASDGPPPWETAGA